MSRVFGTPRWDQAHPYTTCTAPSVARQCVIVQCYTCECTFTLCRMPGCGAMYEGSPKKVRVSLM